ncbi:hypothetical protein NL676_010854 [Syzygium grande]|nr:hypothetical protein NL676_010854 [Syzygium grande]
MLDCGGWRFRLDYCWNSGYAVVLDVGKEANCGDVLWSSSNNGRQIAIALSLMEAATAEAAHSFGSVRHVQRAVMGGLGGVGATSRTARAQHSSGSEAVR